MQRYGKPSDMLTHIQARGKGKVSKLESGHDDALVAAARGRASLVRWVCRELDHCGREAVSKASDRREQFVDRPPALSSSRGRVGALDPTLPLE